MWSSTRVAALRLEPKQLLRLPSMRGNRPRFHQIAYCDITFWMWIVNGEDRKARIFRLQPGAASGSSFKGCMKVPVLENRDASVLTWLKESQDTCKVVNLFSVWPSYTRAKCTCTSGSCAVVMSSAKLSEGAWGLDIHSTNVHKNRAEDSQNNKCNRWID